VPISVGRLSAAATIIGVMIAGYFMLGLMLG
jgi:hypothetical protein